MILILFRSLQVLHAWKECLAMMFRISCLRCLGKRHNASIVLEYSTAESILRAPHWPSPTTNKQDRVLKGFRICPSQRSIVGYGRSVVVHVRGSERTGFLPLILNQRDYIFHASVGFFCLWSSLNYNTTKTSVVVLNLSCPLWMQFRIVFRRPFRNLFPSCAQRFLSLQV